MKASSDRGSGFRRAAPRRGGRPRHRTEKEALVTSIGAETAPKSWDVSHLLRNSQMQPKTLTAMLSLFGHLPKGGQYELAVRIINASQAYRLRKLVEKRRHGLPNRVRQLNSISTSARRVLKLLGVKDANSVAEGVLRGSIHPTATSLLTQLYSVAVERRPATASLGAEERMTSLILLLSDLVEAAMQLARKVGHGGERRAGPTAEVELCQAIIASYDKVHQLFPNSGPQLAFDPRLKKFIRLGLKLAVTSTFVARIDAKGKRRRHRPAEMAAVDPRLPTESRTTDLALRGAYERYIKTTDQGKKST